MLLEKVIYFVKFLGLTWLFGFLVTIPGNEIRFVYALLFCILNSTQGFHIFFVYIVISKRRRELLKSKLIFQLKDFKQYFSKI